MGIVGSWRQALGRDDAGFKIREAGGNIKGMGGEACC
jgi:hypothetical protein